MPQYYYLLVVLTSISWSTAQREQYYCEDVLPILADGITLGTAHYYMHVKKKRKLARGVGVIVIFSRCGKRELLS